MGVLNPVLAVITSCGFVLIFTLLLLLDIALLTWLERRLMGNMQRRTAPNVTGPQGLFQPIADGLKLLLKEQLVPMYAVRTVFVLAPTVVLVLSIFVWFFLPITRHASSDYNLTLLYIITIGILEIYGILFAGWSSNSKYALLGGLRSTAQMISYEIALSFVFLSVIIWVGSFNFSDFYLYQAVTKQWLVGPLWPFAIIYLVSMLAESNRAPFDLPEAEAELVAGYNVEYSGFLFALFFLGEYAKMLFLSGIFTLLFLGGSLLPTGIPDVSGSSDWLLSLVFSCKTLLLFSFLVWVRATVPRYRYDQLMDLGWKVFLPLTLGFLTALVSWRYALGSLPLIL